jgi:hypothetical protein
VAAKSRLVAKLICVSGDPAKVSELARRIRDHRSVCSCQMCRNPRRSSLTKGSERKTIQERRHQQP